MSNPAENITEGQKKLTTIKQTIQERKKDGISEEEKEKTRQELLDLKNELQKSSPDNAGELYADIISTWKELKNHTEENKRKKEELLGKVSTCQGRFDRLVNGKSFHEKEKNDIKQELRGIFDETKKYTMYDLGEVRAIITALANQIDKTPTFVEKIKDEPVLSSSDEEEIKTSVGEYKRDLRRHEQNMDLLNRTFPGRLNDHIQFLTDLGISNIDSYFIDIGPGVGDYHDQEQHIRRDYPAITSVEMAKALKRNHTIALDLPESVDELLKARKSDQKIGGDLLGRNDIQVVRGDGLKSLRKQLENARDALGKEIKLPGKDDIMIIRACNSIDIYCDWNEVKPALQKMAEDFREQRMILFFGKKILAKESGKANFTIIGDVSDRGFNHNEQTTRHVPNNVPAYRIRENNINFGDLINLQKKNGFRKKGLMSAEVTPGVKNIPENLSTFFGELEKSDDTKIQETSLILQNILSQVSGKEKELLLASKPRMHVVDSKEAQLFYSTYGAQRSQADYQIVVNINEDGQKAYLLDPSGVPKIAFDISSGKGSRTPAGEFQLQTKSEDPRTIPFRKFGQAYHKQSPDGMIDWDGSAQMTTAILAMNMDQNIYFHGTNKEKNLGTKDSAGCIRMDNISIAFLSTFFENNGIRNVSIVDKKETVSIAST